MKENKVKAILIPAVSLLIICVVVTALLGVTNSVTAPKIAQLAAETEAAAKQAVLTDAVTFSEEKQIEKDGNTYTYYEGFSADETPAGYVFRTSAKGYGGDIAVMVGVKTNGTVAGVNILSISETAGLGMNAKNESFLSQFIGKSGTIGVLKNGSSETEIQALTGATITSKAMASAVNQALDLFETVGGAENG